MVRQQALRCENGRARSIDPDYGGDYLRSPQDLMATADGLAAAGDGQGTPDDPGLEGLWLMHAGADREPICVDP